MPPNDPKGLKDEIKTLQGNIRELYHQMESLGIVLKGTTGIKGVFQQLKESEGIAENVKVTLVQFEKDIDKKFEDQTKELNEKFEKIFNEFKEQNEFKTRVESYLNIIASKSFWRLFAYLVIAGALLVAWSKGGYFAFIKFVRDLIHGQ